MSSDSLIVTSVDYVQKKSLERVEYGQGIAALSAVAAMAIT